VFDLKETLIQYEVKKLVPRANALLNSKDPRFAKKVRGKYGF
jgi:hypothetical protein